MGCNGGSMELALKYSESHPLMLEADYPYKGKKLLGRCTYDKSKGKSHNRAYSKVPTLSPSGLNAAVSKGPVSVAIEADKESSNNTLVVS